MGERKKINWLLILQGWAMLWVVIGHAGPSPTLDDYPTYALEIHRFAYSFHMQLFIAISGFLFYLTRLNNESWTYWTMMKEKLVRFGIPFIMFTLAGMFVKTVFSGLVDRPTTFSISEFLHAFLYPYDGPMRNFWFLAAILWFFALFPFWKFVVRNRFTAIITLFGLGAISIYHPSSNFLAICHACWHAFFFYIGILAAKFYKQQPEVFISKGLAILSFFVGVLIYILGILYNIPLITPIGGCLLSLSIALFIERAYPKCFFSFRNYTYQIYLLSIFAQFPMSAIRQHFELPFTPVYILSVFVGLYVPVLVSILLEKMNWKPLLLTVGLKPKKIDLK